MYEAVERGFDSIALLEPSYPGVLEKVSRCKALIRLDPRVQYDEGAVLRIAVDEKSVWEGPEWIGDLLVEHLTSEATEIMWRGRESVPISQEGRSLIRTLVAGRSLHRREWKNPNLALDMSEFTTGQIGTLLPKVEWFLEYGQLIFQNDFTSQQTQQIVDSIATFAQFMLLDKRVITLRNEGQV